MHARSVVRAKSLSPSRVRVDRGTAPLPAEQPMRPASGLVIGGGGALWQVADPRLKGQHGLSLRTFGPDITLTRH